MPCISQDSFKHTRHGPVSPFAIHVGRAGDVWLAWKGVPVTGGSIQPIMEAVCPIQNIKAVWAHVDIGSNADHEGIANSKTDGRRWTWLRHETLPDFTGRERRVQDPSDQTLTFLFAPSPCPGLRAGQTRSQSAVRSIAHWNLHGRNGVPVVLSQAIGDRCWQAGHSHTRESQPYGR